MRTFGLAAMIAALAAGAAHADTPSDFARRHTASGGNIDAIMADYADDAIVLQNGRAFQGKAEIRKLFEGMFGGRRAAPPAGAAPAAAPPAGGGAGGPSAGGGMKVTRVWEEGNVGFMTWEAGPVHATEEFIIKNNKIAVQAVFTTTAAPGGGPVGPGGAPRAPGS